MLLLYSFPENEIKEFNNSFVVFIMYQTEYSVMASLHLLDLWFPGGWLDGTGGIWGNGTFGIVKMVLAGWGWLST